MSYFFETVVPDQYFPAGRSCAQVCPISLTCSFIYMLIVCMLVVEKDGGGRKKGHTSRPGNTRPATANEHPRRPSLTSRPEPAASSVPLTLCVAKETLRSGLRLGVHSKTSKLNLPRSLLRFSCSSSQRLAGAHSNIIWPRVALEGAMRARGHPRAK